MKKRLCFDHNGSGTAFYFEIYNDIGFYVFQSNKYQHLPEPDKPPRTACENHFIKICTTDRQFNCVHASPRHFVFVEFCRNNLF